MIQTDKIRHLYTIAKETAKAAAKAKAEYDAAVEEARKEMVETELDMMSMHGLTLRVKSRDLPQVTDWEAFYAWIRHNDRFDMLHRRVSTAPFREYIELNQDATPPGTKVFHQTYLEVDVDE